MKKYLLVLIPVVLLITITIIFFPYQAPKETVQKKTDPKTEMVKRVAKMIKEQSQIKGQKASPVAPAPVIEEKAKEPQDRVMASSLREEISRSIKEGKKDIRIVLNTTDDKEEVSNSVINAGGRIIRKRPGFMAVEVPVDKAEQIIMRNSSIGFARLPFKFFPAEKITEGVNLTGANIFHDTIYRGAGVKVAVVDGGFKGLTAAISAGELPSNVITHDFSGLGLQTEYYHGTACAEIVHDMAPDAELHLIKLGDEIAGYEMIDYCIDNNIDIVSVSMGTFGSGPGDGTGPVDEAFDELKDAGILVVASAGNHGNTQYEEDGTVLTIGSHWEGTFTDTNSDTHHEFERDDPNSYYNVLFAVPDKDDDGKPSTSEVSILMRWDDWPVSYIDYDMYLYSYDYEKQKIGTQLKSSITIQNGTQPPVEYISWNVPDSATKGQFYALRLKKHNTSTPTGTKLEIYLGGASQFVPFLRLDGTMVPEALATSKSSIVEPADAESVIAVGAIDYKNWTTGPNEDFSSQGPTNDWNGNSARIKPDVMGPDGVTTYTYGDTSFSGTSAAAPHVAGIAALNLNIKKDMSTNELQQLLEDNAIYMGMPGMENQYGLGRATVNFTYPIVKSYQKLNSTEGNFQGTLYFNFLMGSSVASIRDLNRDGILDLAVGVPGDNNGTSVSIGAVYILFMNPDGTVKSHQKISSKDGNFLGTLDRNDGFGNSIAYIGDLNGDGIGDLAVGAKGDDDGNVDTGAVWILFLNTDGTVKSNKKISSTDGNFTGILNQRDRFGSSIASIGDLNGDGISDLAVGAEISTRNGAVWILFMNNDGTVRSQQKISETEGNFTGYLSANDRFASSVAYIGDLNGDGIGDLAVGAERDSDIAYIYDTGAVWILFMNTNGTVKSYSKISNALGDFSGKLDDYDNFGSSVAYVGDLNGDGTGDLAVGEIGDDIGSGAVWMLFLNTDGTVKFYQKISDTQRNFTGTLNNGDSFGSSVAPICDLNGDGVIDLAVGAPGDDDSGTDSGAVWVIFLDNIPFDKDHDSMLDTWETKYGLNTNLNDASSDPDGDGLTNIIEYKACTHPKDTDSDNDGMPDGWEVQYGLNPLVNDAGEDLDGDHFSNIKEYQEGTLPNDRKSRPKRSLPWLPLLLGD